MLKHYLKFQDLPTIEVTPAFIKQLLEEDRSLGERLVAAYKIADRHETSMAITINDGNISYVPVAVEGEDTPMGLDEAIILAVELHHIFQNNPNIDKLAINTRRKTHTYLYRGFILKEPNVAVIVLNSKGSFLTSYDPKRQELYPAVDNLSAKNFQKCDAIIADTLEALTKQFKANINKERADEEAFAKLDD